MAKLLKLRGGTTSQHSSFTGSDREVTVDTDKETLVVHNGSTAGGFPLARADGTGTTNFTISGEMQSGSLDVNGNGDISGTLAVGGAVTVTGASILNGGIDVSGDFTFDVGGGDLTFKDDGTSVVSFGLELGHFIVNAPTSNTDIIFKGNDGGSAITALTLDMSEGGTAVFGQNIELADDKELRLGNSHDLKIYHDPSNGNRSVIKEQGGGSLHILATNLNIENTSGTKTSAQFVDGGAVSLYHNDSKKFETKSDGVDITGELQCDSLDVDGGASISGQLTMGGNVNLQDNDILQLGSSQDLKIYHDGSNSYIDDVGTGDLIIRASDDLFIQKYTGENMINCNVDGSVDLYHNNVNKLQTSTDGIYVSGNVQALNGRYRGASSNDYMVVSSSVIDFVINGSTKMRLESDGDLHADGDVVAFSTTVPSDERLKTDIEKIENATDKISQLSGYTFTYKEDGKKGAGVIAQELEKVLPSAVKEKELSLKTDDGVAYKTVEYNQIIGLLIESIKELKQEINELKGV